MKIRNQSISLGKEVNVIHIYIIYMVMEVFLLLLFNGYTYTVKSGVMSNITVGPLLRKQAQPGSRLLKRVVVLRHPCYQSGNDLFRDHLLLLTALPDTCVYLGSLTRPAQVYCKLFFTNS